MLTTRLPALALFAASLLTAADRLPNPVFAYEIGPRTPSEQARMMRQAGFDGTVFDGAEKTQERLQAMDAEHLQLFYLWLTADVGNGATVYEPGMEAAIHQLAGRGTVIWLAIKGSGNGAEKRAVEAARHVAALAAVSGLRVALYPHFGFFLAKFDDAVRVAEAAHRSNLGVTFNVCHELRAGWVQDLPSVLQRALPRLYGVTLNGADQHGTDWPALIQPLGRGDFDVTAFLQAVVASGYRGPIGIQCYGITEPPTTLLPRSHRVWDAMSDKVAQGGLDP